MMAELVASSRLQSSLDVESDSVEMYLNIKMSVSFPE